MLGAVVAAGVGVKGVGAGGGVGVLAAGGGWVICSCEGRKRKLESPTTAATEGAPLSPILSPDVS